MRTRFGVSVSSPISAQVRAGRGRRDQDRAKTAGVAQPAPQKVAAVAAAAMQRHHQRPRTIRRIIFRHIERKTAAAAGFVVVVDDAGVFGGWRREPLQQGGIFAQRSLEEELAHRRQFCDQRIERFLRARRIAQRLEHRDDIAMAIMHHAQAAECGERRVACGFQRGPDAGKFLRPVGEPPAHRLQRLIRRAGGLHHAVEIRRMQMARDEATAPPAIAAEAAARPRCRPPRLRSSPASVLPTKFSAAAAPSAALCGRSSSA